MAGQKAIEAELTWVDYGGHFINHERQTAEKKLKRRDGPLTIPIQV